MASELSDMLTDSEVASIIRRSRHFVKALRLSGALRYLPGRPPLVQRADIETYLEAAKVPALLKAAPRNPTQLETDARAWALRAQLKAPRRRRGSPK